MKVYRINNLRNKIDIKENIYYKTKEEARRKFFAFKKLGEEFPEIQLYLKGLLKISDLPSETDGISPFALAVSLLKTRKELKALENEINSLKDKYYKMVGARFENQKEVVKEVLKRMSTEKREEEKKEIKKEEVKDSHPVYNDFLFKQVEKYKYKFDISR